MAEKFPVTFYGRKVGMGQMVGKDGVSVELDPEIASLMRQGMVGGLSVDSPEPAVPAGAPSSSGEVPKVDFGRRCGCLPGETCMYCRNSFTFRREALPAMPPFPSIFRRNWEAINEELGKDLRGDPVPGFKPAPLPARLHSASVTPGGDGLGSIEAASVEGMEVRALLCSSEHHARPVPAVVVGDFRVPWWEADRVERATYCQHCARLAVFIGYFTPDHDGWQG